MPEFSKGANRVWFLVLLMLSAHAGLALSSSRMQSLTADEPLHLSRAAGLAIFHDSSFAVAHPAMINFLDGLPLLTFRDLKLPDRKLIESSRAMDSSDRRNVLAKILFEKLNPDARTIFERARLVTLAISLFCGLFVFLWARKLHGAYAGLFALFLYSFDPNILASARLVTNDAGAALFICLALYFLWRLWEKPSAAALALAALSLGLAESGKFSAILLYPFYIAVWLAGFWRLRAEKGLKWWSLKPPAFYLSLWALLIIFLGSLFVIWAGYGFETFQTWNFKPIAASLANSPLLTSRIKYRVIELLGAVPLPPRTFYYGLSRTLVLSEQHENALYFMGRTSEKGWWYYYPVLFLIKTPLPLLALLAIRAARRRQIAATGLISRLVLVLAPVWFLVFFMLLNRKEIGIRHLLMIYPLIFVLVSGLATDAALKKRSRQILLAILFAWFALSSTLSWPDYLTYFNEAVLGRRFGLKISVVGEDWGQGAAALARAQEKHNWKPLYYQPYVLIGPDSWGLEYQPLDCEAKKPGYYAIHLTQLKRPVRNPELIKCVEWLGRYRPSSDVGRTIYVWKMPEATAYPLDAPGR